MCDWAIRERRVLFILRTACGLSESLAPIAQSQEPSGQDLEQSVVVPHPRGASAKDYAVKRSTRENGRFKGPMKRKPKRRFSPPA